MTQFAFIIKKDCGHSEEMKKIIFQLTAAIAVWCIIFFLEGEKSLFLKNQIYLIF